MAYRASYPRQCWLTVRRTSIQRLAQAHAQIGELEGPGRPLEVGRPVAHAYVVRVVAEFQAFARDLHDLGASVVVQSSMPSPRYAPRLVEAATAGRGIDRGNANLRTLQSDFRRLGIQGLQGSLASRNAHWAKRDKPHRHGDKGYYEDLINLRNALAHGNQVELDGLRRQGVLDTVSWARARLPGLDRIAKAMDQAVWDHLHTTFGQDPW